MSLKDVKGQEQAIEILKNAFRQQRIAHAYLFLGPKGAGKTKAALEFIKLINCQAAKDDSCGECPSCLKIDKLMHPDLFVISKDKAKMQISIDAIRKLQERLSLKPFESKYKAIIIDEAEFMTHQASNSLLKVLEEPTSDTIFILTGSNLADIAETVVSRCQILRFRPLAKVEVNEILMKNFDMEEKEANFLSAISSGNIGKALLFKDKDIIRWKNDVIDSFVTERYNNLEDVFSDSNRSLRIEALAILLGFYRDIMVYKLVKDQAMVINIDRLDIISKMSEALQLESIQNHIKEIEEVKEAIQSNVNTKLAMEVLRERLAS